MKRLPMLLFVCVENSCRSQMAEGFARERGAGRVAAHSAGSRPSGWVHPRAIKAMEEKGIDLRGQTSKSLFALPKVTWDCVITMGCREACPRLGAKDRRAWAIPDPKGMPMEGFRKVRDEIERNVLDLIGRTISSERAGRS